MITIALPEEVAASCLEIALALSIAARGDRELAATASFVHRCYVRAVSSAPGEPAHEMRWRRFVNALDAYLRRCASTTAAWRRLHGIVLENADLVEREEVVA